jgi:hypothetical protein
VAAAGAGVGRWFPGRCGRSRLRRDHFHRAHARPRPVPGRTGFLFGGIHAGRADALRGACLPVCFLLRERIIVSAGECVCALIGSRVQVANLIPEIVPVRLPDPDPDPSHIVAEPDPDPDGIGLPHPDSYPVHLFPHLHADERTSVRVGTGILIGFRVAGAAGLCPADRRRP